MVILAFTMFNVFLPKLLEMRQSGPIRTAEGKPLEDTMWDVVIFTLGGCPGAIVCFSSLLILHFTINSFSTAWCLPRRIIIRQKTVVGD